MPRLRPDARTRAKMVYKPADLVAGMLASLVAGLIFRRVWSVVEPGGDAPKATDRSGAGWRSCSPPVCTGRFSR